MYIYLDSFDIVYTNSKLAKKSKHTVKH